MADFEASMRAMHEQMTAQLQALQTALAQQNEAMIKQGEVMLSQSNQINAMAVEIAAIKSAPVLKEKATLTTPEANTPQEASIESGAGSPDAPLTITPNQHNHSTKAHASLSERLPDIAEFTGKRNQLPQWKAALANKLSGNHDRYPTELAKLTYARARITGEPAITLSRLSNDFPTLQSLVSWLDQQYGDPNERVNAELKLRDLRQGNRPFWKFFTEFRTLASKAEATEGSQYMLLKGAINSDLQRLMITLPEPAQLTDYANTVAKIDEQLRFINNNTHTQTNQSRRHSDAMDIDTLDYAPFGSEERERRRRERLCFKCGSHKHISPDCKKPLPSRSPKDTRSKHINAIHPRTRTTSASPHRRSRSQRSHGPRSYRSHSTSSLKSEQLKGESRN
jgi:hypothetical protein